MFHGWEKVDKQQVFLLLQDVRTLFSFPDKWIYWPMAIDGEGLEVDPKSDMACKWSLMGACELLLQSYTYPLSEFISCAAREYLNDLSNDDLIHGRLSYEEELTLLDLAIHDLKGSNE